MAILQSKVRKEVALPFDCSLAVRPMGTLQHQNRSVSSKLRFQYKLEVGGLASQTKALQYIVSEEGWDESLEGRIET